MSFKSFFLSLTIVAILLFSAFGTTVIAYADDGTTTPPTEPGTPAPGTDGVVTSVVTETAPSVDGTVDPVVTETAPSTDGTVPPEVAPEPILEQLPDNTTVAVVNAEGETQPLVSQASADAILLSDPIWCPAGKPPIPNVDGCTGSYSSFTLLLTALDGNAAYNQAGTIYVQQGAYLGGETSIDFNSYGLTNLNQQALTIQGGWDTNWDPITNPVPTYTTTQFTVPIIIGSSANPWGGSLTFNNISISGVNSQTGLTAYSQGDITVSNVEVTTSQNGANLNAGNDADDDVTISDSHFDTNKKVGANVVAGGSVTISNSTFNDNGSKKNLGQGLEIKSGSQVTLTNVEANNNQVAGANIKATGSVTVTNSFFSGNKSYEYNCKTAAATGGYGLQVITSDAILLDGATASDNYFFGAHLEGSQVEVYNSSFDKNGSGSVSNPVGKGLEVISGGAASLFAVEANDNQLFGANIKAAGDVFVNNSLFNGNQSYTYKCNKATTYLGYGLQVVTTGFINMNNDSALNNSTFGAHLDGAGVAISFSNFSNNGSATSDLTGRGLEVISTDYVSLSNVTANNNQKFGADILAGGSVTINASEFSGNIAYTYSCKGKNSVAGGGYGLNVVTIGTIDFTNVKASDNYLYGANLDGSFVAITEGYFNNNGSGSLSKPVGYGLQVNSATGASLTTIEAQNNQLFGANVKANGAVNVNNGIFSGNQSYSYNCKDKAYQGYGLQVVTTGFASLSGITAEKNYLYGSHVTANGTSIAFSSFSNNGTGSVSDHLGEGLAVKSTGGNSVSLYQVNASNNQLFGTDIQADGYVSVSNSIFTNNQSYDEDTQTFYGYGLTVVTTNSIFLSMVEANFNNLWGGSLTGLDVLVEKSQFNNNVSDSVVFIDDTGLLVNSAGNVTLETVEAKENRLIGADIHAVGNILINNSIFTDNRGMTCDNDNCSGDVVYHGYGLSAIAGGSVTLTNVNASNNYLFGANIQATGAVSVTNSVFSGNIYYTAGTCKGQTANGYGLQVVTTNNITLDNVTASDNGLYGATLDGSLVQVSNSTFENNVSSHGLAITADVVVVENVTATNNGVDGAIICANDVTVNNSFFENNGRYGLNVGSPIFAESLNTYSGNGTGSLFYNPTCNPNSNGNGNGNGNHGHSHDDDKNNDDHHGHGHHDGDTSDHRCSSDKSDGKHGDDKHGDDKHDDKHVDNKSGHHDGKTSDSRCSSNKSQQSHGKKK